MKLLVKKQKRQTTRGAINEIAINETTITMSEETVVVNGLKDKPFFGVGSMENGTLIAVFTNNYDLGLLKLSQAGKSKRVQVHLVGKNRKVLNGYKGRYRMTEVVDLLEDATCYVLKPIVNF